MTLQYMDSLFQRDNLEKSQFFKGLPKIISKMPKVRNTRTGIVYDVGNTRKDIVGNTNTGIVGNTNTGMLGNTRTGTVYKGGNTRTGIM